eukprot:5637296-Lingulodinium_polyedra.AAC.1
MTPHESMAQNGAQNLIPFPVLAVTCILSKSSKSSMLAVAERGTIHSCVPKWHEQFKPHGC